MSAPTEEVLAEARDWIGTPYRHQGSEKGVGCDCLGLVRGIWRALYGTEPEPVPPYASDWAERSGEDRLIDAAQKHFRPVAGFGEALAGDLLLFRFQTDCAAKHAGILCAPSHFIHAYDGACVLRSALVPSWRRRVAGIFRFPEV